MTDAILMSEVSKSGRPSRPVLSQPGSLLFGTIGLGKSCVTYGRCGVGSLQRLHLCSISTDIGPTTSRVWLDHLNALVLSNVRKRVVFTSKGGFDEQQNSRYQSPE